MEEAEIKKLKNLAAMLSFKENLCNFCCGWKSTVLAFEGIEATLSAGIEHSP